MRVVFFGNTNNYPYLLARAVRNLGHEVVLLVNRAERLHRPESMEPGYLDGYPAWIRDVSGIDEGCYVEPDGRIEPVVRELAGADGLVLNHIGPSLLDFVKRPAIAMLTGSDLDYYANFSTLGVRQSGWGEDFLFSAQGRRECLLWADFIQRQRLGIRMSRAVSYFPRGVVPEGDRLLDGIGVSDGRRFFIYMANPFIPLDGEPLSGGAVRIFCGTRLTWRKPVREGASTLDYKGSDVMIRGLGLFLRRRSIPLEVRIVRKGLDVEETEELARAEGIAHSVEWLEEMSLKDFYRELRRADIVFEQLGDSCVGMAGLDAMAMGKPVIANGRPEVLGRVLPRPLPVCQASTPEEVSEALERLTLDEGYRRRVGEEAREYARRFLSPEYYAERCIEILSRPDRGDDPLSADRFPGRDRASREGGDRYVRG